MYQLREIDGRKLINGHEIVVIGQGENGLAKVMQYGTDEKFVGTYPACEKYIRDRNLMANAAE